MIIGLKDQAKVLSTQRKLIGLFLTSFTQSYLERLVML